MTTINYGQSATCELEAPEIQTLGPAATPALTNAEIVRQVRQTLSDPCGYPPLADAIVPGDRVVVSLEFGLPSSKQITACVLAELLHSGVEPADITLLTPQRFSAQDNLSMALASVDAEEVKQEIHDPDDGDKLALLSVTESNGALRMNRSLCEADLVLSCGVFQRGREDQPQCFSGLFPCFSDRETINRFRSLEAWENHKAGTDRIAEVEESSWLLGIGLVVQVIPAPRGGVAEVLAGNPALVARAGAKKYRELWVRQAQQPCDLVVVTVTGDASEQTWENLGRALQAAEAVLQEGGSIAICSEIAQRPGRSLRRLTEDNDFAVTKRKLHRDHSEDSWPAWQLSRALQRGPVYLRSLLPASTVENIGMTPIASDDELQRLVRSYERCIVLDEAQRLQPTLDQGTHSRLN